MDGVTTLIFLSFTMLVGSFISGLLPMALTLSEVISKEAISGFNL